MDCNNCRDVKSPPSVPYIVHESAQARMERTLGRLWVTIVLLIVLLVGTNLAWIVYESQFEDVCVEAEQDGTEPVRPVATPGIASATCVTGPVE